MKLTVYDLLGFTLGIMLALVSHKCAATEVGIHLVSVHAPARDYQNNVNLGLYVINDNGWTFGAYRNTLKRPSVYAGKTWTWGPASITAGLITGYEFRRVWYTTDKPCLDGMAHTVCYRDEGFSALPVTVMLAPSLKLGPARVWYIPRIGNNSSVVHFSLEKTL